jgi:hypothetical protein
MGAGDAEPSPRRVWLDDGDESKADALTSAGVDDDADAPTPLSLRVRGGESADAGTRDARLSSSSETSASPPAAPSPLLLLLLLLLPPPLLLLPPLLLPLPPLLLMPPPLLLLLLLEGDFGLDAPGRRIRFLSRK